MNGITLNIRKQLESSTLIMVLFFLIVGISVAECRNIQINSKEDIPQVISQCRAACIQRFLFERENIVTQLNCNDHSNCEMCWDFCDTLIVQSDIFHSICSDYTCVSLFFLYSFDFSSSKMIRNKKEIKFFNFI